MLGHLKQNQKPEKSETYLGKDEPDVDHLDVGGLWQAARHADEQGRQHQQGRQVHGYSRL